LANCQQQIIGESVKKIGKPTTQGTWRFDVRLLTKDNWLRKLAKKLGNCPIGTTNLAWKWE